MGARPWEGQVWPARAEQTNMTEGTEAHGQFKIPESRPEPGGARAGTGTLGVNGVESTGLSSSQAV